MSEDLTPSSTSPAATPRPWRNPVPPILTRRITISRLGRRWPDLLPDLLPRCYAEQTRLGATTSLHLYNSRSTQKSRRLRGKRLAADVQGFERRTVEEPKVIYNVGKADAGGGSNKSVPFCGCPRVCTGRRSAVERSDVGRRSATDPAKQKRLQKRLQPQAGATSGKTYKPRQDFHIHRITWSCRLCDTTTTPSSSTK